MGLLDILHSECRIELCFTKGGAYEHGTAHVAMEIETYTTEHAITAITFQLNLDPSIIEILKTHYGTDVLDDMERRASPELMRRGESPDEDDDDYSITREDDLIWVKVSLLPTTGATSERSHDVCFDEPLFGAVSDRQTVKKRLANQAGKLCDVIARSVG